MALLRKKFFQQSGLIVEHLLNSTFQLTCPISWREEETSFSLITSYKLLRKQISIVLLIACFPLPAFDFFFSEMQ